MLYILVHSLILNQSNYFSQAIFIYSVLKSSLPNQSCPILFSRKMNLSGKICIVLLASCIFITTNSVTATYNLYFYKKKDCRQRALNILFSQLCFWETVNSIFKYAMVLHQLEFVHVANLTLFQTLENIYWYQLTAKVHCWLLVGVATVMTHFNPSLYSLVSEKLNYATLFLLTQILR